jgi:chemotaxis protein MotB
MVTLGGCVSTARYDAKVAELEDAKGQLSRAQTLHVQESRAARDLASRLARAQRSWLAAETKSQKLAIELDATDQRASELAESLVERQDSVAELEGELRAQQAWLAEFQAIAQAYGADSPEELQAALAAIQKRIEGTERALQSAADELQRERRIAQKLQRLIDAGKLRVHTRAGRLALELPGDIHFASGRAELTEDGKATLKEVAQVLQAEKDRLFVVEGHTDNVPIAVSGFRSNWQLGAARAETSRETLVAAGLDAQHVAIATWADLLPVCSEVDDKACRQRNRRVEVLLLPRFE